MFPSRQAAFAGNCSWPYLSQIWSPAARYTIPAPANADATAIAFAPRQVGQPYQCGAATPGAYDYSRLASAAHEVGHASRAPA